MSIQHLIDIVTPPISKYSYIKYVKCRENLNITPEIVSKLPLKIILDRAFETDNQFSRSVYIDLLARLSEDPRIASNLALSRKFWRGISHIIGFVEPVTRTPHRALCAAMNVAVHGVRPKMIPIVKSSIIFGSFILFVDKERHLTFVLDAFNTFVVAIIVKSEYDPAIIEWIRQYESFLKNMVKEETMNILIDGLK